MSASESKPTYLESGTHEVHEGKVIAAGDAVITAHGAKVFAWDTEVMIFSPGVTVVVHNGEGEAVELPHRTTLYKPGNIRIIRRREGNVVLQ
jgi:L-ascorbate metabolism protein UlaG (beta-lactamase superfamily)